MSNIFADDEEFVDRAAKATRVMQVNAAGDDVSPAAANRTTGISRVATATTTSIAAGAQAYSVTAVAANSGASPTLDGVALPENFTASYSANPGETLEAASVVTVSGDDVIITEIR